MNIDRTVSKSYPSAFAPTVELQLTPGHQGLRPASTRPDGACEILVKLQIITMSV